MRAATEQRIPWLTLRSFSIARRAFPPSSLRAAYFIPQINLPFTIRLPFICGQNTR